MINKIYIVLMIFVILLIGCKKYNPKEEPCFDCPINFKIIDYEPDWSPNGQWIIFCHVDSELSRTGLYLIKPDGSENHIWHQGLAESPIWNSDGQWIAFSENGQIWKKKINGDSLSCVTTVGKNFFPSWSPAGDLIAYNQVICDDLPCGVWITNIRNASTNLIVQYGIFPKFHPLKGEILYAKRWVLNNGVVLGDSIFIIANDLSYKKFIIALSDPNYSNRYFNYDILGSKILFVSKSSNGDELSALWSMKSDGTDKFKISSNAYTGDWNPMGDKIVYTDSRSNNGRLWIMNSDGTNKQELTFEFSFN